MSYSMSFDASLKVKASNLGGYLMHTARDLDEQPRNHANPNIDVTRTGQNVTLVYDAASGGYKRCSDRDQIRAALDERLGHVKKPLRSDAVVMRGIVLQMDPQWYKDHADEEGRDGPAMAALSWAEKTFGKKNLVMVSLHKDEGGDHLHVGFTPVTEDGRLSQKDWFKNPTELRKMHEDLRQHMRAEGYDVERENKKGTKHVKRLTEAEYRAHKAQEAELEQRARSVATREASVKLQELATARKAQEAAQRLQEAQEMAKEVQDALDSLGAAEAAYKAAGANLGNDLVDWMKQREVPVRPGIKVPVWNIYQADKERAAVDKAVKGREAAAKATRPRRQIYTGNVKSTPGNDPSLSL